MLDSLYKVFSQPKYLVMFITLSALALILSIWLPNLKLITTTLFASKLSILERVSFAASFLGGIQTNFTVVTRTITIIISVLFGINISLLIYHVRQRLALEKSAGTSVGGMVSGIVGIGCASCGSVILSSIFGIGATAGFIGVLPLRGQEFGLLGVAVLSYSSRSLLKKINQPISCRL